MKTLTTLISQNIPLYWPMHNPFQFPPWYFTESMIPLKHTTTASCMVLHRINYKPQKKQNCSVQTRQSTRPTQTLQKLNTNEHLVYRFIRWPSSQILETQETNETDTRSREHGDTHALPLPSDPPNPCRHHQTPASAPSGCSGTPSSNSSTSWATATGWCCRMSACWRC